MKPDYELSLEAVEDLLCIQEFVAGDSPDSADRLVEDLFSAFDYLSQ
jgi:plasmid stabilization system protein ParE